MGLCHRLYSCSSPARSFSALFLALTIYRQILYRAWEKRRNLYNDRILDEHQALLAYVFETRHPERNEMSRMTVPNLDQTEGIWIIRTADQGFHYVQDVFPGDTPREQWHQANCQLLIARGHLQPEQADDPSASQRIWNQACRYRRVHT
jgi:hypothetical protein